MPKAETQVAGVRMRSVQTHVGAPEAVRLSGRFGCFFWGPIDKGTIRFLGRNRV